MIKRLLIISILIILLVTPVSAGTYIGYAEYDRGLFNTTSTGATFSYLLNGDKGTIWNNAYVSAGYVTGTVNADNYTSVYRYGLTFNTTTIPSDATITSATISVFGQAQWSNSTYDRLILVSYAPANNLSYATTDYAKSHWGTTPLAPNMTYANFSTSGYNNWTLTNPNAVIVKGGHTALGLRTTSDIEEVPYPWSASLYRTYSMNTTTQVGTDADPYITIEYTVSEPVGFTMNQTSPGVPNMAIQFNDTSTSSPSSWGWNFTDYGNATLIRKQFSTTRNATQLFGAGNFSINLTTNTGVSSNTWLNISAGRYRQGLETPNITGFVYHPADHIYNTNIANMPIHVNSSVWLTGMTNGTSSPANTYMLLTAVAPNESVVDANITKSAPINKWGGGSGSNGTSFPITDYIYQSNPGDASNDHWIKMVDPDLNWVYGIYDGSDAAELPGNLRFPNGTYHSYSTFAINLSDYTIPSGIRADPPTIRYDEAEAGNITHMICFASYNVSKDSVLPILWPLKFNTGNNYTTYAPPNGAVLRLNQSFSVVNFTTHQQHILNGLKNYGAMICDNTGNTQPPNWFGGQSIERDSRWESTEFNHYQQWHGYQNTANATVDTDHVHAEDFEFVDISSLMIDEESGQANTSEPAEPDSIIILIINYFWQFFHLGGRLL